MIKIECVAQILTYKTKTFTVFLRFKLRNYTQIKTVFILFQTNFLSKFVLEISQMDL